MTSVSTLNPAKTAEAPRDSLSSHADRIPQQPCPMEHIDALIEQGHYLSAYQCAVAAWGPHAHWQDDAHIARLIRLLRGLGRHRAATYLELKRYRRWFTRTGTPREEVGGETRGEESRNEAPQTEEGDLDRHHHVKLRYFMYVLSRKGAIACYDMAQHALEATCGHAAHTADWKVAKAIILCRVRDFAQAHALLDTARQQPATEDWAEKIRIRALEEEGRWEAALTRAQAHFFDTQCPFTLEMIVRLLQAQEGPQAALSALLPHLSCYQSVALWQEAANTHFQLQQYDDALACLGEVDALQVMGKDKGDAYADGLRSQLYLEMRHLPAAQAALRPLRDGFSASVRQRLSGLETLSPVLKLNVPHVTQKHMTCAPSSLAAVVRFWGQLADEDAIAEQICFEGTSDTLQREWLIDNGWRYLDFDLTQEAAETLLARGVPFTLVTTQGMSSHLQVVKGIDREAGYLYLMDPSVSMESKILTEATCQLEAVNGPHCRAIVPVTQPHLLGGLALPAQALYPLRHELDAAVEAQDVSRAHALVQQLVVLDPTHRLTLLAQRKLAGLQRDDAEIERVTDQLLAQYPDTTYLVISKYHCLRTRLGHREAYQWLSDQFKRVRNVEVFTLLLEDRAAAETLSGDDDGSAGNESGDAIDALAKRARIWTSAEYFWLKGHDAWRDGDKDTASRLYRWALCLEPSQEAYLRSYYVTYLDQGRVDEALATLQELFEASILVSASMAYSLYRAYCLNNEEHVGLAVLARACEIQPSDAALIAYYLGELGRFGQWAQFETAYDQYAAPLSAADRLAISAKQAFAQGDNTVAIERYEALLALQPGNDHTVDCLLESYHRAGLTDKVHAYLATQRANKGESLRTLNLLAQHSRDDKTQIQTLETITERYPLEYHSARRLAYFRLAADDIDSAERISQTLLDKDSRNADNVLLQAEICLKRGQWTQAKAHAKAAIAFSPNSDAAFEALMRTHTAPDEKVTVIREFAEVLKRIPNADDGVWHFWQVAGHWLDTDELRAFCDAMISRHGQNWCVWVVSAYQREQIGDIEHAIDDLDHAAKRSPLTARIFGEKARMLSCLGRYEDATPVFEYAITLAPGWPFLAMEYNQHLERIAEPKKGLVVLERCRQFNDDDGVLLGHLADSYLNDHQQAKSLATFVDAISHRFYYPWAWNKLYTLSEQLDDGQTWRTLLATRQQAHPNHVDTWLIAAQLSKALAERIDHLQRAVVLAPTHLEANRDLVEAYMAMGRDDEVYALINGDKWDGRAPLSLAIKEPMLLFERGDYTQALVILTGMVTRHPRYEAGWLLRMQCAVRGEHTAEALTCAEALEVIAGNDLEALYEVGCVYEQYGDAQQQRRILGLFERAYAIGPQYKNIAFSYLDRLLEEKQYVTARHVANAMDAHFAKPWIDARRYEIYAAQGHQQAAIDMYQHIVAAGEDAAWLYNYPLAWAEKQQQPSLFSALWQVLDHAMSQHDTPFTSAAADVYAQWCEKQHGLPSLLALLDRNVEPAIWRAFCYAYLEALSQKRSLPAAGFWERFDARIYPDMALASQKGLVLLQAEHYYEAKAHYEKMGVVDNPAVPGCALYHCAYVCSNTKDYALLEKVMPQFLSRPKDSSYNNGLVWYCYVQLRLGQRIDPHVLSQVTEQGLTSSEKSMLAILQCAVGFDADRDAGVSTSIESLTAMPSTFRLDTFGVMDLCEVYIRYLLANSTGSWWKKSRLKRRLRARLR
ncbi:C39 family peptidase [Photobacterium japonica]|uniref:C39 family peptidase n=1 Tax=Photobacterium japonica TaxID=2910235 RepID=UPI003D0E3432